MFLKSGERLPQADAMSFAWPGNWPAVRSPKLNALTTSVTEKTVSPTSPQTASADAIDKGNFPLTYDWEVVDEATMVGIGGEAEPVLPTHPECITGTPGKDLTFTAPAKPGAYRLFVTIRNGQGTATTANVPFQVQ